MKWRSYDHLKTNIIDEAFQIQNGDFETQFMILKSISKLP